MNIGIIGLGVVGSACQAGFESQGNRVFVHDTKLNTNISDVLLTEIIYVCIPTPTLPNGKCNLAPLLDIINQLKDHSYTGVVAIKSTVTPGTTTSLQDSTGLNICFVPEFLREWCAFDDFVKNHKLLAVGCTNDHAFDIVKRSHGTLPVHTQRLLPVEAEILKYYSNTFNALRVTFANNMFELCQKLSADYDTIKDTYLLRQTATADYMDCNQNLRGFGGMCLPKDILVLINTFEELGLDLDLFKSIERDNKKFKKTIHIGMREQ
jgi:UDPglucose 6-dehydrogenase